MYKTGLRSIVDNMIQSYGIPLTETVGQARLTRMQAMKAQLPEPPAPFLLQQLDTVPTNS